MADNYEEKESYIGYYIFVIISAIIGFSTLLVLMKVFVKYAAEKALFGITEGNTIIPIIVAVVGTVFFIFLALLFKKFLKSVFLSEIFLYLYIGVLTTAINIIAFSKFLDLFNKNGTSSSIGWKIAEVLAFIVAVIFAFVTNKIFVFKSIDFAPSIFFKEFGGFIFARIVTEIINFVLMWILIDINKFNANVVKIAVGIIVIVLNYIFSKFLIFNKKKN